MALSINTVWEIRPTVGSDNSGGGFVAGASGTDFSQQNAAQFALSGIASAGTGDTILSAAAAASMVGNIANVISGTNFTTGFFEVVSVVVGVSITFSTNNSGASICTGIGDSGVINIGGSLATLAKFLTGHRPGNRAFIKATGTLTTNATMSLVNGVNPARNQPPNQIIGYTTTRGDNGRATIQAITNTGIIVLDANGQAGWFFKNLDIDCNNLASTIGIRLGFAGIATNCKVSNWKSFGITTSGTNYPIVQQCEVTGGNGTSGIELGNNGVAFANWVHDNTGHGITAPAPSTVVRNLVTNNTGDGIAHNASPNRVLFNTCYGNGGYGINFGQSDVSAFNIFMGNLLVNNGAHGFNGGDAAGSEAEPQFDGNAYFNNTAGTRRFCDDVGAVNPINAATPYVNVRDVILSGDPFTNAAGNDFTLNNTAGAGAAVRAAGFPGTLPGGLIGYPDIGALQHQETGGSGGMLVHPGMSGGMRG